mgnify:CR=1 FL=1
MLLFDDLLKNVPKPRQFNIVYDHLEISCLLLGVLKIVECDLSCKILKKNFNFIRDNSFHENQFLN